ncbi:MAG TPA: polyprenyl synthetase family protein, partial [Bacteroidales bacterium]|nr:polyprenyl synthetase family protein [Bacteroidales bacterium]
MSTIDTIKAPIIKEMNQFEVEFKASMKSNIRLLTIVTNFLLRRKGKQMRPMLVFLSARMLGDITKQTYTAASLIELLHTATLVHDDVVDESFERRGFFSINALWKSKIAVLLGDYLLAQGLLLSVDNDAFDLLRIVSEAVKEMSEGELLQIQKSRRLNITNDQYFEISRKNTATLIAACTACGAKSVDASEEDIAKMKEFGECLGIAFQIKDDLFDYQYDAKTGKPSGNDIKEKKFTLPLIYALANTNTLQRRKIISTIRLHHKNKKKVEEVIEFVKSSGGIDFATEKMNEYKQKA